VTTNGALKLFFTQNNARLEETALELESVTSSDDLVTHASLCSEKSKTLPTWPSAVVN
jgi:mediator of RNA polymerase II transcription subunit 16